VLIDVDDCVGSKVYWVGTIAPCAVVFVRVERLNGERLPATGRTAVQRSCPGLAYPSKVLFYVGDELVGQGVPIGPKVGRVDGIRVVVVWVGVLYGDNDDPGEIGRGPVFVELVAVFLVGEVVSFKSFGLGIWRCLTKADGGVERAMVVSLVNHEGVSGLGMFVVPLGKQEDGFQVHRPAPKFGQEVALNSDVLDVLCVFSGGEILYLFVHLDLANVRGGRIDFDFARGTVDVARRQVPFLALSPVHWELDNVTIAAVEGLVNVQHGLDVVLLGGKVGQAFDGAAQDGIVDHGLFPGFQVLDIDAEYQSLLGVKVVPHLEPWFCLKIGGQEQQDSAV